MRNVLYGVLFGVLVSAGFSWWTARKTVRAAALTSPTPGRFEMVQLHPSAGIEWSGILDTETGCTWVYETSNPQDTQITQQYEFYLQVLGDHSFGLVNFDPTEYGFLTLNSHAQADYSGALKEISRVQTACSEARLAALKKATTQ